MSGKYLKVHKSVFASWVASYVMILCIPLVINSLIYIQSSKIIEKEITDSNAVMLEQFQKEIDGHLKEIENLSIRISVNPELNSILGVKDQQEIMNSYALVSKVRDMNESFNIYTMSSRFVDSFYIVFNNKDLVWYSSNLYTKKIFYDTFISNNHMDYEAWSAMMDRKYMNNSLPVWIKSNDEQNIQSIAHFQSIPISLASPRANLVIIMNQAKLNEYIQNISKINNSLVCILDKDNHVLFSSDKKSPWISSIESIQMQQTFELIERKMNNEEVVISYIASDANDWKYVSVIPSSEFKEKVVYVRNLTMVCFVLCVILGGVAIVILTKKNYNPLKELVNSLKNKFEPNKYRDINEFGFIKNSILEVYNENEFINKRLELQNNALRSNFVSRLLKGRFAGNSLDSETLTSLGIAFVSNIFIVTVFYIESNSKMVFDNGYTEEDYNKIFENTILQEFSKLLKDGSNIYYSEIDEMIACVINVEQQEEKNVQKEMAIIIEQLQSNIHEKANLDFTIAVSSVAHSVHGIPVAYQEAMEAMEYRLFDENKSIIYYDEIKLNNQKKYNYYYTIEDEQKLINIIKTGNYDDAREILERVIKQNFSANKSVDMAKCVVFDLISTFIKALNNEGVLEGIGFLEGNDFIGKALTRKTLEEMKEELLVSLKQICDFMLEYNQDKNKNKNKIVEKVRVLVDENYSDVNLNVSTLADQIGMNSKYIATVYKEATAESILELINRIRIEKAKTLLEKDMTIAQTAQMVGFSNSNALIRAFKKFEGITPGQYKESL